MQGIVADGLKSFELHMAPLQCNRLFQAVLLP